MGFYFTPPDPYICRARHHARSWIRFQIPNQALCPPAVRYGGLQETLLDLLHVSFQVARIHRARAAVECDVTTTGPHPCIRDGIAAIICASCCVSFGAPFCALLWLSRTTRIKVLKGRDTTPHYVGRFTIFCRALLAALFLFGVAKRSQWHLPMLFPSAATNSGAH